MNRHSANLISKKISALFSLLIVFTLFITACGGSGSTGTNSTSSGSTGSNNSSPATGSVANTPDSSASKEPIKIGALLTLSGPFVSAGEALKEGLETYLDEVNRTIAGRKVEVIYEDDENNAQVSIRKFRKLKTSDNAQIFIGGTTSTTAYALRDPVDQGKVPFLVINAGANDLAWDKKSEYIYKTSLSNWQLGVAPAEYIAKNIGKKIYVVAPDYPAGYEQAEAFKSAAEKAGGTVLDIAYAKVGISDYATILTKIAQANPEVVYITTPGADGIRFATQYKDFGLKGKIPLVSQVSDEIITTPEVVKALDGEYYITPYSNQLDNAVNKKFVAEFNKKYNRDPFNYMMLGYTAGQAIGKAIEQAGSTNPQDLVHAFKGLNIDTPIGPIKIDPQTHVPVVPSFMMKYVAKDGKMTYQLLENIKDIAHPATDPSKK
jgi:branched-chain amino acid transport system substrate-binding protein